ncbi:MAG: hypothetical protein H3Z50_03910 [archaeon]|nr:hypothetical protein [archaeon]MCP8306591.1 hypothetical protein [archaeon]
MKEVKKEGKDYSILGIMCFFISGFLLLAWILYMLWEIEKAPIIIELFMQFSGFVGGIAFALLAVGTRLIIKSTHTSKN